MNDKELVAQYAAQKIEDGMIVGLGTGSTANCFIEALARRHQEGLKIKTIASSVVSAVKAREVGLPQIGIEQLPGLDVYVDGADEVAPDMTLLKGRGYDLVREKLLAGASREFWVLIDPGKRVGRIGERYPIPVEVIPFAWRLVRESLAAIGGKAELRQTPNKDGLVVTSHGSLVLDTVFPEEFDSRKLDAVLNGIPGVIEHGIFSRLASAVFCAHDGQVEEQLA
ncbi:ribose-5-phosphate isomerase RpiA [Candidatus Methylomicrobium oryzae]|jgi:ribose 5-phosphate isomerase A|uniref:ribose-5-phosphate isomerase RpiA n=1 Tax=Candidatus Methylomicrobium oryzae TaxID=2802053 RepID=UPI0019217772|nr:ribose-5-phosphate isomerase RpiA [Methylomicrobium sp. RS1]MBL1265975.1 ribose-5-phosphate isomerase RpiA [Methylomicrobium sp. RS1]